MYHRPGRPLAETSECQCGEQREKENGQDQPEGGLNAVRAEKERRPGEIEGQLYGEERERRRTPIRTARVETHRQCKAHQRVSYGQRHAEPPAGRNQRGLLTRRLTRPFPSPTASHSVYTGKPHTPRDGHHP